MNVEIKTIPHKEQRYDTCGDYWKDGKINRFRVSKMNDDYEFLVVIHELIEAHLAKKRGIKWKDIDNFDKKFEAARKPDNVDEPGNDAAAPYKKEHRFAENIERQVALELGVDWFEYEKVVEKL